MKVAIGAIILTAIVLGVIFLLPPKPEDGAMPSPPGPITIHGEITCLPKKGPGPHTLECAIGLKAESGHYALRNLFAHDPEYKFSTTGMLVEVSGTFSPEKTNYDTVGVIDVASIKELTF